MIRVLALALILALSAGAFAASGGNLIELNGRIISATWRQHDDDFYFPVLALGRELGFNVTYVNGQLLLAGRPVRCHPVAMDGDVWVTRNELRHAFSLRVQVHPVTRLAKISSVMGVSRPRVWTAPR